MISGFIFCTLLALLLQASEVSAYYYYSYHYVYYFPVGGIIGSIVGALCFIGAVIGFLVFFCCVRKRRLAAASRRPVAMTLGTPITTVSGNNAAGGANYPKQDGQSNGAFVGSSSLPPPYPEPGMQQPAGNGFQQPQMPHQGGYYPTDQPQYPQQQPPSYQNFAQNDAQRY